MNNLSGKLLSSPRKDSETYTTLASAVYDLRHMLGVRYYHTADVLVVISGEADDAARFEVDAEVLRALLRPRLSGSPAYAETVVRIDEYRIAFITDPVVPGTMTVTVFLDEQTGGEMVMMMDIGLVWSVLAPQDGMPTEPIVG